MATNLMSELMNHFRGDTLSGVAAALGDSPAQTQVALGGAIPAAIGALASRASNIEQASGILDLIRSHTLDSNDFDDLSAMVNAPGGVGRLIGMGAPLLSAIFGSRSDMVTDLVATHAGVSRSSSSSMLKLALPMVLGVIGRHVRRAGWNPANLMSLLDGQRTFLKDAPAGFADVLGTEAVRKRRGRIDAAAATSYAGSPDRRQWLWALPLLLLIPLVGHFLSRDDRPPRQAIVRVTPVQPSAISRAMPTPETPVGTSSVPAAPFPGGPYHIHFDTGSQAANSASADELRRVVDVLRTHPRATADVSGYTDNTGSADANSRLSYERAAAVVDEIASHGIDRSRLTAQGFGVNDPVGDNGTAEGRERNRRVEVRIEDN